MHEAPDWLPELLDFAGDWSSFVEHVYDSFCNDFVSGAVTFRGVRIGVRRVPESQGKGSGFWHCVSEGRNEDDRVPDLDRCRRIRWIRAVIENAEAPEVDHWTNKRRGETHHLLWYNEDYLVVLAERTGYFLLKTAYLTDREHTRRKLRAERDA